MLLAREGFTGCGLMIRYWKFDLVFTQYWTRNLEISTKYTFEGQASSGKALALARRGERRGGWRRREKHQLCRCKRIQQNCKSFKEHQNCRHLVSMSAIRSDFASESLSSLLIVTACCLVSSTRSDTWVFLRICRCMFGRSTYFWSMQEHISKRSARKNEILLWGLALYW